MMRKLILFLLLSGIPAFGADIDFLFDYPYTNPGCVDAFAVNCIEAFEIRDQRDGAVVATATATPGANTPAVDILATAIGYGRLGNRTFAAYAIARDNEGGRIESRQSNEVSTVIRPFPPENTRGNQQ